MRVSNCEKRKRLDEIDNDNIKFLAKIESLKSTHEEISQRVACGKSKLEEMKAKKAKLLEELNGMEKRMRLIEERSEHYYPKIMKEQLNQYLEYKGNIRVFVRVRPILGQDFKAYGGTPESFEAIQKSISVIGTS